MSNTQSFIALMSGDEAVEDCGEGDGVGDGDGGGDGDGYKRQRWQFVIALPSMASIEVPGPIEGGEHIEAAKQKDAGDGDGDRIGDGDGDGDGPGHTYRAPSKLEILLMQLEETRKRDDEIDERLRQELESRHKLLQSIDSLRFSKYVMMVGMVMGDRGGDGDGSGDGDGDLR